MNNADNPDPWDLQPPLDLGDVKPLAAAPAVSLSGREIASGDYRSFFSGAVLAELHAQGNRYVDFSRSNYGILPSHGFVIFDPGGWMTTPLDPNEMAGDFLVPALELSDQEMAAFVAGYVEHAYISIEPTAAGYTSRLLDVLGCRTVDDPRVDFPFFWRALEILRSWGLPVSPLPTALTEEQDELIRVLLLAVAGDGTVERSVVSAGAWALFPDARYATDGTAHFTLVAWVERRLRVQIHRDLCRALISPDLPAPSETESREMVPTGTLRPSSAFASRLLEWLDDRQDQDDSMRLTCLSVMLAFAQLISEVPEPGSRNAALSYASIAFSAATSPSLDVGEFELRHFCLWHRYHASPLVKNVSLSKMVFTSYEDLLVAALFFVNAARFEMAFWGASFAQFRKEAGQICWYALERALRCCHRAHILSRNALFFVPGGETLPPLHQSITTTALAVTLHTIKLMGTALVHGKDLHAPLEVFWGSRPQQMIEEGRWIEGFLKELETGATSVTTCAEWYKRGHPHHAFEDFTLEGPAGSIKLSRQDVYGRSVNEDGFPRSRDV